MYRVSPEAAVSAATFSARSKQTRSEPSQSDGFSALVNSNAPDSPRETTSAGAQSQRLDGGDTSQKPDNRAEARSGSGANDNSRKTLKSSKSGDKSDLRSDAKSNSKTDANNAAGSKTVSNSDVNAGAKTDKTTDATTGVSVDAKVEADPASGNVSLLTDEAAANLKAAEAQIAANTKTVVTPTGTAEAATTKPSADNKKSEDSDAIDSATSVAITAPNDSAAILAVAIPAAVISAEASPTASKSNAEATGTTIETVQSAGVAAHSKAVAATAETNDTGNATASVTDKAPAAKLTVNEADNPTAVASASVSSPEIDQTHAANPKTQAAVATDVSALDKNIAAIESASATAQPIASGKPKATQITTDADATAVSKPDSKADAKVDLTTPTPLPGQSAQADTMRGSKHTAGESDKQTSAVDTSDAAPTETKQTNASAGPSSIHGDHHAPAVVRAAPADLNLQPVQIQQTPPLQAQTQNLTVTPAVQINSTLANTPVPVSGLAVDIALRAAGGSSRFEIRLDPAELGRIDVRLDVDKHGNVTSHLTVERPATLDMLRQDAPKLQQALQDAGLKTGDSGLQFSLRDQSQGRNDDNGSGRNSQRLIISDDDAVPAQVAGRTYGRGLASSSGVDISV